MTNRSFLINNCTTAFYWMNQESTDLNDNNAFGHSYACDVKQ